MDFGVLPPEINSGRMYTGPGSAPLLAAASAWRALAAELEFVAGCYRSVVTEVGTGWTGPSATAMAAAATPYVTWLHGTAAAAEQTAGQTFAAAAAFEAAFAMTVPPPVITANRAQLAALIATNYFGQNLPAIAVTEAAYGAMWAQDATAMYTYAGAAAGATVLARLTPPPQAAEPAGSVDQAALAGQAGENVANAALTNTQQALAPSTLQGLTSPPANSAAASAPVGAVAPTAAELPADAAFHLALIPIHLAVGLIGTFVIDGLGTFVIDPAGVAIGLWRAGAEAASQIPYLLTSVAAPGGTPIAASMGQALPLSGLSVPTSWTTAAGESQPAAARSASPAPAHRHCFDQMAMAGTAGLASAAGLNGGRNRKPVTTTRRVVPKRPAREPAADLGAEIRELLALHGDGLLTDEEYAVEKHRMFE